jgi:hypothetical protein
LRGHIIHHSMGDAFEHVVRFLEIGRQSHQRDPRVFGAFGVRPAFSYHDAPGQNADSNSRRASRSPERLRARLKEGRLSSPALIATDEPQPRPPAALDHRDRRSSSLLAPPPILGHLGNHPQESDGADHETEQEFDDELHDR